MPEAHGGARPRAGRKRIAPEEGVTRPATVWLTPSQIEQLRELGEGNVSAGVRRMMALAGELATDQDAAQLQWTQTEAELRRLRAELRRLQGGEREALRVLGAIITQHVQGRVEVPEEALVREYTVSRTSDPASMTVRFRAEPADAQANSHCDA